MLAPDNVRYVPPLLPTTRRCGSISHSVLDGTPAAMIALPGATRSGLISQVDGSSGSPTGPRDVYDATPSSDRATVPRVFSAPTVSAPGVLPGQTMAPMIGVPSSVLPRLPADATTTRPAATARST